MVAFDLLRLEVPENLRLVVAGQGLQVSNHRLLMSGFSGRSVLINCVHGLGREQAAPNLW